jgi:ergothioneine biosynthesis protein EgtB
MPEFIREENVSLSKAAQTGRYSAIRKASVDICKPLSHEDHVVQPAAFVSPPKWHLAHSTWFFEHFILSKNKKGYKAFNESYNYLFNSYYDSAGSRVLRTDRGNITRPGVEEILQYRAYVDEQVGTLLETGVPEEAAAFIELGLHHEQQHQELLYTDIKYILGHNPLFPQYHAPALRAETPVRPAAFIDMNEGIYGIGYDGDGFCFDNEKGRHKVFLHAFRFMDRLITNGEYLGFMEDGGYDNALLWLAEGWDWVKQNRAASPLYWYKIDNNWYNYSLSGLLKVNESAPVTHVSYYEADAFARWKGKRLLTEFEWEAACSARYREIPSHSNFADKRALSTSAAHEGDDQLLGNAWEWTSSAYLPYPYYKQATGALGEYNGKFMVNQMVLRGGSCVTPRDHMRITYRNFFHPDERWQFTGIRLAESIV